MRLVVFFSRGMSLEAWHRAGILDRELALYRELAPDLERLAFVTYGAADDQRFAAGFPGLDVLPNAWRLPSNLYSVLAPILHRRYLRAASVFRTNQINGGWCASVARRVFGKPLIVRCGFLWADNVARLTSSRLRQRVSRALERMVFRSGDRVIVASPAHAEVVRQRYGVAADRITVIPNYVDTRLFRPADRSREPRQLLFVGRLESEKRVATLIEAVGGIPDCRLMIVGDGPLRASLETQAKSAGGAIVFLGRLPHDALPEVMARSEVLVLPSAYEGNPKVVVEAMACGLPVVGTRVPGIADAIVDGVTGILCDTTAADLRRALIDVLGDAPLRARLAAAALSYVEQHCSLTSVVARERNVLASLALA